MTAGAPIDLGLLPQSARIDARGRLTVAGCDVADLATEHGTPLYLYDEEELRIRCREYSTALGGRSLIAYAGKAFLCGAMVRVVDDEGLALDVASGGELQLGLRAGFAAARMVFHGNDKSEAELRLALRERVGRIVVDSFEEIDRVELLVASGLPAPKVWVRVTPGVEAHTHEHVLTGADDSKFGFTVSTGTARDAAVRVHKSDAMELAGLHCHIGSQIADAEPFARAAAVVAELAADIGRSTGAPPGELNLGGGLAVRYTSDDVSVPSIAEHAAGVRRAYADAAAAAGLDPVPRLVLEAGRSIAGPAGITLYTVGSVKEIPGVRTYVAVDGGMGDNPRPAMYGSRYEAFLPERASAARPLVATVAGRHCEQGDLLVRDANLPAGVVAGDVLATPVTGAYSSSMASNYNLFARPAVVFVRDGRSRVVVRRETFDDLVARDVVAGGSV